MFITKSMALLEKKMQGAKDIIFATLKTKGADLQKHSAVDQVMYRTVAEELLKHADSGTYPLSFPPARLTEPRNSGGIANPQCLTSHKLPANTPSSTARIN